MKVVSPQGDTEKQALSVLTARLRARIGCYADRPLSERWVVKAGKTLYLLKDSLFGLA
jgi:hypothetical protein